MTTILASLCDYLEQNEHLILYILNGDGYVLFRLEIGLIEFDN